jgi:hypothetical protein
MTTKNEETRPDPPLEELPELVQAVLDRYRIGDAGHWRELARIGRPHLEGGNLRALSTKHEVAILAGEVARIQTELSIAQDALLQTINPDALQAVTGAVALAMSGVDVEDEEPDPALPSDWGTHATHCCPVHGCKYGDEDCPVADGRVEREIDRGWCQEPDVVTDPSVCRKGGEYRADGDYGPVIEDDEELPRPSPDFQSFVAALREEAEWSATIHEDDDSQAVSDQGSLYRLAIRVETTGRGLGLWENGPQELAPAERVEIDMGELVDPDPLRVWPVFIRTADHDPYFAIRGDGRVSFQGEVVGCLPPWREVMSEGDVLMPPKVPSAETTWIGLMIQIEREFNPRPANTDTEPYVEKPASGSLLLPPANPVKGQTWRDGDQLRKYDGEVWEAVDEDGDGGS